MRHFNCTTFTLTRDNLTFKISSLKNRKLPNKWMNLSPSKEKWQLKITQSDAKPHSTVIENKTRLSLADRYKDTLTSQQCRQKATRLKNAQNEIKMAENWFQVLSAMMKKTLHTHTKQHLSLAAWRKQNCAIKNIIGLSFLFVCHGGSRKLQLREELRATLLSPLQKAKPRHRPFTYSFTAFEIHLSN